MVIAILGGGNIGTLMGAEMASCGHEVRMVVSDPGSWSGAIAVYDSSERVVCAGGLAAVTSDIGTAVEGADVVFVTYPTFALARAAERLLPCMEPGQAVGVVPGNDAEFLFAEHVGRGCTLFGLQRVHCVARLRERGRSVYRLGAHRDRLHVAALPASDTARAVRLVEDAFRIPAEALPTYLAETLTPSNPILHTSRIRTMFGGWRPGVTYDHNILFYEEWDIASAERMLAADAELQALCRRLEGELGCDLSGVRPLREHYESPDALSMVAKITSIPAFRGLGSPMLEVEPGRWAPDFSSRYFRADFAYGLKAIRDISALVGADTPTIDEIYSWYLGAASPDDVFDGVPGSVAGLSAIYR